MKSTSKSDKNDTRKIIMFRRKEMSREAWERDSSLITRALINHSWYREASYILAYVSKGREVDTRGIILHALANGKRVYAPVADASSGTMEYYRIFDIYSLRKGAFGIMEPEAKEQNKFIPGEGRGLILVPGVAFDRSGNRIGMGGGYYDRYLASLDEGIKSISPAFSFQITDYIPAERHDLPVDCIITEKGVIEMRH